MSIFTTLDWNLICSPLQETDGCGIDLQYDAAYDAIRRARQVAADTLPSGMWERPEKKIDWELIGRQCFDILTRRSKDLQVGAWMIEAFVGGQGIEGAARGMSLFCELTVKFWPEIYPRAEDGDIELRLRPVNWLLRESLTWFSCQMPVAAGRDSIADLDAKSPEVHWLALSAQFSVLEAFLVEQIPGEAPSFRDVHQLLQSRVRGGLLGESQNTDSMVSNAFLAREVPSSRDAAYEQLREIAVFLARVEPHSPVPMVIGALATWRDVCFEDLLERLPAQGGASVYELMRLFKNAPRS